MKDPVQIVNPGSDFSPAERELVAAGRAVIVPPEDRARIWASVAAACVATGVATAGAASASAATGTTLAKALSALVSWKGVVLVAVLGGGVATFQLTRPAEPPAHEPPARPPSAPAVAPSAPAWQPAVSPPAPATPMARPRTARQPAAIKERADDAPLPTTTTTTVTSRLAEESRAVIAARRALRDGDPGLCLRLLEAAHTAFPDGSLAQEREALTIQALASSGQREQAARRAARFLHDHPESPHAADLRQIVR
jgi:hypothetical protein